MRYSSLATRIGGPGSGAWDNHFRAVARKAAGEDVIVMSIGDPDFDTPPAITDAAIAALKAGDTHYSPLAGRMRLRKAVASYIVPFAGIPLSAENVAITFGTQNALYAASTLLLNQGDEALVLEPCFTTYRATIESTGARAVTVPCLPELGWQPNMSTLEASITPHTRAIYFASPANPTGAAISEANLATIAELAIAHDLWIVSDEIYCDFIFDGAHHSIAALPGMAERTIIVGSLSKSHAMTGWRVGWAIGPEAFVRHATALNLALSYGAAGFIQEAAAVATEQRLPEVDAIRERFRERRDLVMAALSNTPGLHLHRPAAGMFVMIDVRETGMDSAAFAKRLYEEQAVSLLDGAEFGPSGAGFVRLSFATDEAALTEGCRRIRVFAEGLARASA
ncbi:MAG: aminotransferase class I/II-fold pyridoxal phosphate-dependent enzyme [Sphingomonadaceae bacterium]